MNENEQNYDELHNEFPFEEEKNITGPFDDTQENRIGPTLAAELSSLASHFKWELLGLSVVYLALYLLNRCYLSAPIYKSTKRLDGKTVIVTGANTGIGKDTALDLAKRGARVILACRDLPKANKAADEIRRKSGNGNVVVELVDLASLQSVKQFAERILANEARIDILVNNAGKLNEQ